MDKIKLAENLLKIGISGWGDQALTGFLVGLLDGVTPEVCWEYISDNKPLLLDSVSESKWRVYRRMGKAIGFAEITPEMICQELSANRPDLMDAIVNHPNGRAWVKQQLAEIQNRLLTR